jgi:O-antigen/teichoic acid export membrane protein
MRGAGAAALAAQSLVTALTCTLLGFLLSGWRPRAAINWKALSSLSSFSTYYLAYSLLEIGYARFYALLIGKSIGRESLGYYTNADTLRQIPGSFLSGVLSRVWFPLFSQVHDISSTRNALRLAVRMLMLVNAPLLLGMSALAEPLVLVLLGPKWQPAVPIVRILCVAGVLWPLQTLFPFVLMARNGTRLLWQLEWLKKPLGLVLLTLGVQLGTVGVAASVVAFGIVVVLINALCLRRLLAYPLPAQLRDIGTNVLIATLMSAVTHVIASHWHAPAMVRLVTLIPAQLIGCGMLALWLDERISREILQLAALLRSNPESTTTSCSWHPSSLDSQQR